MTTYTVSTGVTLNGLSLGSNDDLIVEAGGIRLALNWLGVPPPMFTVQRVSPIYPTAA